MTPADEDPREGDPHAGNGAGDPRGKAAYVRDFARWPERRNHERMTLIHSDAHPRSSNDPVIDWLLDSDPSIRWQVMRDLTDTPAEIVAVERSRIASEGW